METGTKIVFVLVFQNKETGSIRFSSGIIDKTKVHPQIFAFYFESSHVKSTFQCEFYENTNKWGRTKIN